MRARTARLWQAMDWPSRRTEGDLPRMSLFDSVTTVALHSALDGLALRQRVIANNVANIQTPGFLAGKVSFENALAQAVADGTGAAPATVSRSLEPTRTDGNNVNLDEETLSNVDTNLRYQLATRAMDDQFNALRTAMKSA